MIDTTKPVSPFLTDREAGPAVRNIARLWDQCGVRNRTDYRAIRNMLQTCADAWTASDGRRYWVTFNREAGLARTSITDRIIEVSPEPTEDASLDMPSLWAVLTSYLAHEATHDRYWRSFKRAMDEAFGAPGTALRSRAHVYDNLLQDIAGERMFVRDYPGIRGIFNPMLAYIARRTPHGPMLHERPVNRAICATRYAEWNDWTGCEADRDWWQAWADRWTSIKPTPRRWVAAVREALQHDADTQHEPEPQPEPQPGGDSITEPGPSTDEPEDGEGGAGTGEPNGEPDEGDEDGEPGAGTEDGDEDEDESEEPGEGGAGTESEDEGDDESEPGAGGEGEDEAEGEPEDGESEADGEGTGDGAGTDTSEPGEPEDDPGSHEGEGWNDARSGEGAGHGDGKVHPESEPMPVPEDVDQDPTAPVCPTEATRPDPNLRQRAEAAAYVEPDYVDRPDRTRWPVAPIEPDARLTSAISTAFQRSRTGDTGYDRGYLSGMLDDQSLYRVAMDDRRLFGRRTSPEPGRFNVYVMVDLSGSMTATRRQGAAMMAQALALASRHQPNLRLSVYAWASGPVVHIWQTGEPIAWPSGLLASNEAGGGTEDTRAVRWAIKHIRQTSRGSEVPIVFVISDGEGQPDLADAVGEARQAGITVVGVSIASDYSKADVYGNDWVPWQGSVAGAAIPLAQIIARAVNPGVGR